MTQRRYTEAEVAAIFEQATREQTSEPRQLAPSEGMTLAEIQDIGREVGIEPAHIQQAALTISLENKTDARTFMGLPIGVSRTIELGRKLSDDEWDRLVVDLRDTFDARGVVREDGAFRQWTNGNLQVLLEPTPTGDRVRFRTMKANARAMMVGGMGMLGIAGAAAVSRIIAAGAIDPRALPSLVMLAIIGVGMFGSGALRVPLWARERKKQMADVAARLLGSTSRTNAISGTTTPVP